MSNIILHKIVHTDTLLEGKVIFSSNAVIHFSKLYLLNVFYVLRHFDR